MEGYLEKKSPSFAVGWQRRWIVVKDFHIFYCRDRITLNKFVSVRFFTFLNVDCSEADVIASKKFLNCISLMVVQSVHAVNSKSKRKSKQFEVYLQCS